MALTPLPIDEALPRLRAALIAQRLRGCADSFLGAALHDWAAVDPACDVRESPGTALVRLVAAQLHAQLQLDEMDDAALPPAAWRSPAARDALLAM